jgi:uncharacterized sulfatase
MSETRARPNVVWLTLDSVRADHTTMDGYRRDTTPGMARIAALPEGESFRQCIAAAKWSLGSVASMQTCTYPEYNLTGFRSDVLPESVDTVAEALSEAGYFTAGVSANGYFCAETGTDRGYESFQRIHAGNFATAAGPVASLRFLANIRKHSGGFTTTALKHRPDFLVNQLVKKTLRTAADGDRPFFVTAHYHGAHIPYYPPVAYQDAFLEELETEGISREEALDVAFRRTTDIYEQIAQSQSFTEREWTIIEAMYDSLLRHCDDTVSDVFEVAREIPNTIVVITADHGDLLGEYGLLAHKLVLHDALVRVPLVVWGLPELTGRGDELVQHVDVMRTILELAGAVRPSFQGIDLLSGSREFAVSQRGAGGEDGLEKIREHNPAFDDSWFHESELHGLRTDEWKYLESEDRVELFRLPDEFVDVSADHPELVAEFDRKLEAWRAEHVGADVRAVQTDFSEDMRKRLADLGYLAE